MGTRRQNAAPLRPPATTPEGRQQQLIAAAFDLAERQIREGTASSQIVTHFLKMGSPREELEEEKLRGENLLLNAKAEELASRAKQEVLYQEALDAMKDYTGHGDPEDA